MEEDKLHALIISALEIISMFSFVTDHILLVMYNVHAWKQPIKVQFGMILNYVQLILGSEFFRINQVLSSISKRKRSRLKKN